MNKNKKRKEKLYEIYSQNLSWVKKHPKVSFEPNFEKGYICPLCFNLFDESSLNELCLNPLTFDQNPPTALGGKQGVLTCKECNSKAGHKLDNHLLARLEELDFRNSAPNSRTRAILQSDNYKISSNIEIDDERTFKIHIDRKNSNPNHIDKVLQHGT